jgi:hypothetical protein
VHDWSDVHATEPEAQRAGPLHSPRGYEDIKRLAKHLKRPVTELMVLAPKNDPFYAGQPARRTKAVWFAHLWQEIALATAHLRRIHYRLVSLDPPMLKPDGIAVHQHGAGLGTPPGRRENRPVLGASACRCDYRRAQS